MDAIPSAHLRQQKLEHQRQLIEQKQKQKRQAVRIRSLRFLAHFIKICFRNPNDLIHKMYNSKTGKTYTSFRP